MKYILAIETSCDETAASIVKFDNRSANILSNIVSSQIELHKKYGGIVPEVASRAHLETINPIIQEALLTAKTDLKQIDYFAVTEKPGLIGSLLIGIQAAKTLAWTMNKPLIKINHLDGHFWSAFIDQNLFTIHDSQFPILSLLVSGGHTQLILSKKTGKTKTIGETLDDAAGEAFDKAAQILGLSYPGGPAISAAAEIAEQNQDTRYKDTSKLKISNLQKIPKYSIHNTQYQLPIPMIDSNDFNFSFSGLKTALLYKYQKLTKKFLPPTKYSLLTTNLAFSFQKSLVDSLVLKTISAAKKHKPKTITLVGGVAANKYLREKLKHITHSSLPNTEFLVPDFKYCTDNAAMIGAAAAIKLANKK